MPERFETVLDPKRPVSDCRALVPYAPERTPPRETVRANAAFLTTLITQSGSADSGVRRRRRPSPATAIARYRESRELTDPPALTRLKSL